MVRLSVECYAGYDKKDECKSRDEEDMHIDTNKTKDYLVILRPLWLYRATTICRRSQCGSYEWLTDICTLFFCGGLCASAVSASVLVQREESFVSLGGHVKRRDITTVILRRGAKEAVKSCFSPLHFVGQ